MPARPTWQGHLRLSLVSCPVKLFTATTSADNISFHLLSRETKNRLKQQMVDPETGEVVDRDDQVSGYEFEKGRYILVEKDEIAALKIDSSHTIEIERFVHQDDIDVLYWESPYFMVPDGDFAQEAFAVIREAMRAEGVVAIGRVVMANRERPVAIQPRDKGFVLTRLRDADEVRDSAEFFDDIPDVELNEEMISIAEQIIEKKRGAFDPAMFTDRYQEALHALVDARIKGEEATFPQAAEPAKVVNLFEALRKSLDVSGGKAAPAKKRAAANPPKRAGAKEPKRRRA